MTSLTITDLNFYPIKSFPAIAASSARVRPMGFELDRRWMLVDESGTFITQREHPVLATFTLHLSSASLEVRSPAGQTVSIPLQEPVSALIPVTIWNNRLDAFTYGAETDQFFADALKKKVRLVRIPEAAVRPVDPHYGAKGDHVSFADGYPVLLTCSASLDDLNARMEQPIPMNRFRPNIVVDSTVPFEEEEWTTLNTEHVSFRIVKRCARCTISTTDQSTGERYQEPLKTLATYRKRDNEVYFGMNCIPDDEGTIAVGESITVRR